MRNYDYLFKVVLLGTEENQTNIFLSSINNFADRHRYVLGVDFGITTVEIEGRIVKLQIWTPITSERFAYIRPMYYRGASHVILLADEVNFPNLIPYVRELLTNSGPVPVDLVLRCSSQFAKALEGQAGSLRAIGLTLPLNILKQPQDLYNNVGQSLVTRERDLSLVARLNLYIDDEFPWGFINSEQDDVAAAFMKFLEDLLTNMRNWNLNSLGFNYPSSQIDETTLMRRLELYYEIIESMGAEIDEEHLLAIVENDIGRFKISLRTGSVMFIPKECFDCKNPCYSFTQSLCIVERSVGWSSEDLSKKQLLILSKIYALKNEVLPKHVWNQMKGHKCYSKKNCSDHIPRRNARFPPGTEPIPTIAGLRNAMLAELERLKRIMRGE